jgi:hypothetical protein
MTSLVDWHLRLHRVTGSMALRWARASSNELREWASELWAVAGAMEQAASGEWPPAEAEPTPSNAPEWLLEELDSIRA